VAFVAGLILLANETVRGATSQRFAFDIGTGTTDRILHVCPNLLRIFQSILVSVSAVRMAWTAIAAMTPVRKSPETPIPIASARVSACRGTISP
jgi:hypothetical protein